MGLNLPSSDGNFSKVPIIKYDSRAGRIFRVDRTETASGWEANQIELPQHVFQAVFDIEQIEVGWLHFPTGGAPDLRMVKLGQPFPDKPSDKHRAGFRVYMKLGKESGGDLRELAANAAVAVKGMDALVDLFDAGVKLNPGKLPLVKLGSTLAVTTSGKGPQGQPVSSTNYQPVWEIVRWIDRPPELQGDYLKRAAEAAQAGRTTTTAAPPPQAAAPAPAPPPPPAAAPAPAMAGVDDDF
jgi:hypothetical protein